MACCTPPPPAFNLQVLYIDCFLNTGGKFKCAFDLKLKTTSQGGLDCLMIKEGKKKPTYTAPMGTTAYCCTVIKVTVTPC
jgi:hypothetical protein